MQRGVVLCAVLTIAAVARAQPRARARAALAWTRAPGADACMDEDALLAATEAELGRPLTSAETKPDVLVTGHVAPRPEGGFSATFLLTDANGDPGESRRIETGSADCRALDESLPLVAALLIDLPREERRPVDPRARHVRTWPALHLGADGAVAAGLLPGLATGLRARALLDVAPLPIVELDLSVWRPSSATSDEAQASLDVWHAGLSVCPFHFAVRAARLLGCLGARTGRLDAVGSGLARAERPSGWLLDGVVRGAIEVRMAEPLVLRVALGGAFTVVRQGVHYTDRSGAERTLYRPPPAQLAFEVGIALALLP